jgi:hypothetical protein
MDDNRLTLICKNEVLKKSLSEEENLSKIIEVLAQLHHKKFEVSVIEEREFNSSKSATYEDVEKAIMNIRSKIDFDVQIQ